MQLYNIHFYLSIGGKWRCVHIDDPRSPLFRLPSLSKCMSIQPQELIAKVIETFGGADYKEATNDLDLPPPLEDADAEVSRSMCPKPKGETNISA